MGSDGHRPAVGNTSSDSMPLVSVVVVTHQSEREHLQACLESVGNSEYRRVELVVVDNGSTNGVSSQVAAERKARFVEVGYNSGFAAAVNRGIEETNGHLVFFLNPDAYVEPNTIALLVDAARRRPEAVGFAPKMVFTHDSTLIDSVGIAINSRGAVLNRGIGQLDIGQYDIEEPVVGCCFGAAMIRREAFAPERLGMLDASYFLYYEDADWCLRATLRGYDFWTVPSAVVNHVHSATSRNAPYAFKYRLIQRNLLHTVFKNFERRRAVKVFLWHCARHSRNVLRGPYRTGSLQIVVGAWIGVLRYLRTRAQYQRLRRRPDVDAFRLGVGERSWFDPEEYAPLYQMETAHAMLSRLWMLTGDERWGRAVAYVDAVTRSSWRYRPAEVCERLERLAGPIPEPLRRFFQRMQEEPGMIRPDPAPGTPVIVPGEEPLPQSVPTA